MILVGMKPSKYDSNRFINCNWTTLNNHDELQYLFDELERYGYDPHNMITGYYKCESVKSIVNPKEQHIVQWDFEEVHNKNFSEVHSDYRVINCDDELNAAIKLSKKETFKIKPLDNARYFKCIPVNDPSEYLA